MRIKFNLIAVISGIIRNKKQKDQKTEKQNR